MALAVGLPARSVAAAPPLFTQFPEQLTPGGEADQLSQPRGVATSPVGNRHLYVAEVDNRRVSVFTAWGEFVRAFGWGVLDGSEELQTCTEATGCQAGLTGSGPGQFGAVPAQSQYQGPTGVAIDSTGDVWVMDLGNFRLQKFDPDSNFILMVGGGVNETSGENVCTAASGDTCVGGEPGTGPGEFSIENKLGVLGDYLDVAADDTLYVGDRDRIQTFAPGGAPQAQIPLPEPGNPGALAIDPVSADVYFAFNQPFTGTATQPGLYRLNPTTGSQVGAIRPVESPVAVAVDGTGTVFAVNDPPGGGLANGARVVELTPAGSPVSEFNLPDTPEATIFLTALAASTVGPDASESNLYVANYRQGFLSYVRSYGGVPNPAFVGPPPSVPPTIVDQFAATVGTSSAILHANINPRFWADTSFHLEYGTVDCAVGPCQQKPPAPGKLLTDRVTSEPLRSTGILLDGLEPGTTYHYRFVSQSGGGGPVVGSDATFTTRSPEPPPNPTCANQQHRGGAALFLPDCRAYEMVTPVDKNFADVIALQNVIGRPARRVQARPDGTALTYSAFKAFAGPEASPYSSQYLATRGTSGWGNRSISPPRSGPTMIELSGLDAQFKAFTPDLCGGWFLQDTTRELATEAVPGYPNLYRASLCEDPTGYEAITRVQPPLQKPNQFLFELQGAAAGHSVFRAGDKLTPNAPAGEASKVYDYHEGSLSYVCLLPNGTALSTGCSAGSAGGGIPSEDRGSLHNAISADGNRIFWTASGGIADGRLYLRSDATQTTAISAGPALFWGAAADGSRVIFGEGETLYEFEVGVDAPESGEAIAGQVVGVAGISEDASRVYLVSREALDGDAEPGKPNLYLAAEGEFSFIAELAEADVNVGISFSPIAAQPFRHGARVTPDGGALAFVSNRSLTGSDNLELQTGKPVAQVFLFHAQSGALRCVSCNATGARPIGRDVGGLLSLSGSYWASAFVPATESQLYFSRALSGDGQRIFFNSFDSLVGRDANNALDVYQWEANGKGDCTEAGGCVRLISSGESPQGSEFIDASADGSDVFFSTDSSLVARDPGLIDVYDARVGGGFASPPPPAPHCQGEACQLPPPAPPLQTPGSASFLGPSNPTAQGRGRVKPKRCAKGKRKVRRGGKVRCVPKKKAQRTKRSTTHRRRAR